MNSIDSILAQKPPYFEENKKIKVSIRTMLIIQEDQREKKMN